MKDDSTILSSDQYGVFNLYKQSNIETKYLTNVNGGAFMPDISSNGQIVFSIYDKGGYKVALLKDEANINQSKIGIKDNFNRSDYLNKDEILSEYIGIGVRIEDDVLVTSDGNEVLTASLPVTAEEIESLVGSIRD